MSTGGAATVAATPAPVASKSFLLSKGFWAGIVGVLVAAYEATAISFPELKLPSLQTGIFAWILSMLTAFGLYGRLAAKTALTATLPGSGQ